MRFHRISGGEIKSLPRSDSKLTDRAGDKAMQARLQMKRFDIEGIRRAVE